MMFRDIEIGQVFEFTAVKEFPTSGMMRGPWEKISPRRYRKIDDVDFVCTVGSIEASADLAWTPTDISSPIELRSNEIEFQSSNGDWHHFYIVVTDDRIAFGGATNTGFLESGYLQRDDCFSLDEQLQSLIEDLEVFYNDGPKYTSEIVCNDRM